jgi:hypothetical protein
VPEEIGFIKNTWPFCCTKKPAEASLFPYIRNQIASAKESFLYLLFIIPESQVICQGLPGFSSGITFTFFLSVPGPNPDKELIIENPSNKPSQ